MKRAIIGLIAWALNGLVWADGSVATDLSLVGVIGGETNPKEAIAVIKDGGRTVFLQMGDTVRSRGTPYKITKIAGKSVTINNPSQGDLTVIVKVEKETESAESILETYASYSNDFVDENASDIEAESDEGEGVNGGVLSSRIPDGAVSLPAGIEIPSDNQSRPLKRRRIRAADADEAIEQLKNLQDVPSTSQDDVTFKSRSESNW
jgi:hypothetical protein